MNTKEGLKEVIQPHMDQPCGLWCLSRGLTLHYNRLNCIGADENGSFLVVTRRKRECIRGEQTESSVDSVVVSDIAGIAEGNGRSSRLIIKDIRHRDNSPRQIAGLWEIEERGAEGIFAPIISGSGSDEEVDDEAEVIIVADEKAMQRGAVSG